MVSALLRSNVIICCLPSAPFTNQFYIVTKPQTVISPAMAKASNRFTFSLLMVKVPGRATSPNTEIFVINHADSYYRSLLDIRFQLFYN